MILQVAAVFGFLATFAFAGPQDCDPSYDCLHFHELATGELLKWDFRDLCSPTEYSLRDNSALPNMTYSFNFCRTTKSSCNLPEFVNPYPRGVASIFWNWAPPCPPAEKKCRDPQGNDVCCSSDCTVLGFGAPNFVPVNKSDGSAGINITHTSVPADDNDPFECPYDPIAGRYESRSVTYVVKCDPKGEKGKFAVTDVIEDPQCQYAFIMKSVHGCGTPYQPPVSPSPTPSTTPSPSSTPSISSSSVPPVAMSNSKFGGIVAGSFFGGIASTLVIGGGCFFLAFRSRNSPFNGEGTQLTGSASKASYSNI